MFGMFGKSFPKELKFLYWNVRHFNASSNNKGWLGFRESRAERVFMKISEENPDIFGISEVTDDEVFKAMEKILPDYSYSITDGSQSQETLVGVRNSLSPVFRQKAEFKGGSSTLRPAALTRIFNGDNPVRVLFCHLKSSTEADSFELRKKMCQEAAKLKRSFNALLIHVSAEILLNKTSSSENILALFNVTIFPDTSYTPKGLEFSYVPP